MSKRAVFTTKLGVIAATVGSAVGLGNIWRFPYEAGVHGGGAFLIIYIACVFVIGMPVMLAEFAVGRHTHSNGFGAFKRLNAHPFYRLVPIIGILASLMVLSFYSVVSGWIMEYLYQSMERLYSGIAPTDYARQFQNFIANPWRPALWTFIFLVINGLVLKSGVQKGIERVSNILMPCLMVMLIIFALNSLVLPEAARGVEFLFKPDFGAITPGVFISAMGQAFFTLSLGLTCLLTYSSYFSDGTKLGRSALITAFLDTLVAILAGLIIFPAVFTYGFTPEAGPRLVFEILPSIFAQMPYGHMWAPLFFLLLFFASLTSTISLSEISIAFFIEEGKMSRSFASFFSSSIAVIFGVLCALSFGPISKFTICGLTLFNLFDYLASNILMPLGGLLLSIFVGWKVDKTVMWKQMTNNGTLRAPWLTPLRFCLRWVAPVAVLIIFIYGLL